MKRILMMMAVLGTLLPMSAQKIYTLTECRRMAIENNNKIKDAGLTIEQAKEQEKEAFSKYLPQVSLNGVYFHSKDYLLKKDFSLSADEQQQMAGIMTQLGLDPTVLASLPSTYSFNMLKHGTVAQFIAMEPIYAGGQITTANKLAKLQTEVKRLQMKQSQDEIINTTETYYNQLLTLYEKRLTLDAADRQLVSIHQDAKNAYQAGVVNKNDMLSVELKQNEIAANRLKLENGIKLCKMVLAQYIGLNGTDIQIDTTLATDLPNPKIYLVDHQAVLDNRTEAQLLDKNVEANHLLTRLKRGAMLPTVAVGAAGVYHDLSGNGQTNVLGMVTVSVPISSLWSANHSVRRQRIAEQMARQDREDNRQLLLIQMQSAYNDLDNAYKQILLARKSIETSAENLRLNEDYYHAGTSTMSDLLNAQTRNQQSRDQYADAVSLYLNSRTAYLIATSRQAE
ncbi:MAG: TolC family protein [Prevotella sp.]|jgi:outer membrane protein|nr:TolC family protein [Prevotella sp.]MCI1282808.1 TolC family protein [Prevotella sp.]